MANAGKGSPAKKAPRTKPAKTTKRALVNAPSDDGTHIAIRKIENGWLVRESRVINGKYVDKEVFTPTKPTVNISK